MFASRFRECAARALLLPRRRPDRRTPAVAAAPAGRRPAGGGGPAPRLPDPARGHPRVPQRRLRPARPAGGAARPPRPRRIRVGPGRDAPGVAVRPVAAVRLDRRLHVRGRRAAGRAPGRGACRSTATCCATCSAPRSCASCSTRRCWPTSSWSCSASADDRRARDADELHDVLRTLGPLSRWELDIALDRRSPTERGRRSSTPCSTSIGSSR